MKFMRKIYETNKLIGILQQTLETLVLILNIKKIYINIILHGPHLLGKYNEVNKLTPCVIPLLEAYFASR